MMHLISLSIWKRLILFTTCLLSLVSSATGRYCDTCHIVQGPDDIEVSLGGVARFNCNVAIETGQMVYWRYGNQSIYPWPNVGDIDAFTYPEDAHVGLNQYDLVVKRVTFYHHKGKFWCGIRDEIPQSRKAVLTVVVPPDLVFTPRPTSELIEAGPHVTQVRISCSTNYADPEFDVTLFIDGFPVFVRNLTRFKERPGGGRLKRMNLVKVLKIGKYDSMMLNNNSVVADELRRRKYERMYYEENYRAAYLVSCQITNSKYIPRRQILSTWVVFKDSGLDLPAELERRYKILYGLGATAMVIAILMLSAGLMINRYLRYLSHGRNCCTNYKKGVKRIIRDDTAAASEDVLEGETLRNSGIAKNKPSEREDQCRTDESHLKSLPQPARTDTTGDPQPLIRRYPTLPRTAASTLGRRGNCPRTVRAVKRSATLNSQRRKLAELSTLNEIKRGDVSSRYRNYTSLERQNERRTTMPRYNTWNLRSSVPQSAIAGLPRPAGSRARCDDRSTASLKAEDIRPQSLSQTGCPSPT